VAALRPTEAAVVAPTIVVAATEATTMVVVPVRGTKRCHAVAEVAVPVLAAAEVLNDGPATSMEAAAVLSCHKASKSKSRESIPFLPFYVLLSLAYSLGAEQC
jgi:mannose/fructose/N-acetylgalactosamine-specific phosphotransferase system component IIC